MSNNFIPSRTMRATTRTISLDSILIDKETLRQRQNPETKKQKEIRSGSVYLDRKMGEI